MSQNQQHEAGSIAESIVKVLTEANAIVPAAVPGIAAVLQIFKSGAKTGKSLAEMEAEAHDSMETTLRIRAKSDAQMGSQA